MTMSSGIVNRHILSSVILSITSDIWRNLHVADVLWWWGHRDWRYFGVFQPWVVSITGEAIETHVLCVFHPLVVSITVSSFGGINHRGRRRLLVLSLNPPLLSHQEEQSPDKPIVIGQQSLWTGSLCTLYVVQRILTLQCAFLPKTQKPCTWSATNFFNWKVRCWIARCD